MKLSRPEVGSSRINNEGSVMSSIPMAILFLSPPERVFLKVEPSGTFETERRPSSRNKDSTLSFCYLTLFLSLSLAAN